MANNNQGKIKENKKLSLRQKFEIGGFITIVVALIGTVFYFGFFQGDDEDAEETGTEQQEPGDVEEVAIIPRETGDDEELDTLDVERYTSSDVEILTNELDDLLARGEFNAARNYLTEHLGESVPDGSEEAQTLQETYRDVMTLSDFQRNRDDAELPLHITDRMSSFNRPESLGRAFLFFTPLSYVDAFTTEIHDNTSLAMQANDTAFVQEVEWIDTFIQDENGENVEFNPAILEEHDPINRMFNRIPQYTIEPVGFYRVEFYVDDKITTDFYVAEDGVGDLVPIGFFSEDEGLPMRIDRLRGVTEGIRERLENGESWEDAQEEAIEEELEDEDNE